MELFTIRLGFYAGIVLLGWIFHVDIVTRLDQMDIFTKVPYLVHQIILTSWQHLGDWFFAPMVGYSFYASIRRYHPGKRSVGIWLIMAVVLTILLVYSNLTLPYILITIIGVITIALVTEIIQTKNELHLHKKQLEMLVNQRTADLYQTNTRLKKRIKYLEKETALHRQRESNARALIESNLHQHIADLDILNHVVDLITEINDLPTFLRSISEIITERFNANSTYVLITSDENEGATVLQGYDCGKGPIKPILLNDLHLRNTPLVQKNFLGRKSIIITDITSPVIPSYLQLLMVCADIQSMMLLPLWIRGEIKGLVFVCRGSALDQFWSEDTKFAEAVVTHFARAIENAGIVETIKGKAVREERDRLAREMHDTVTQTIYTASLITQVLPSIWDRNPEEGKRNLIKVRQLVHGALAEMRTILFELRPSALEMASLETLIRQLVVIIAGRDRIQVQMSTEGDFALPRNVHITIYRIAQEIFNNIAKHSEATHVQAILKLRSDGMTLNIADNGKGFLPHQASSEGMGLRIMQERAALIGARINIASKPMQGTIVMVTWSKDKMENVDSE